MGWSLEKVSNNLARVFGDDGELVAQAAASHGVSVYQAGLFSEIMIGHYNHRTPFGSDTAFLLDSTQLDVMCMDRRFWKPWAQAFQVDPDYPNRPVLAIAGGIAQPDRRRQATLVEFLGTLVAHNPYLMLNVFVHNGVCGGADHMTKGRMTKIYSEDPAQETQVMAGYAQSTITALYDVGVSGNQIVPWLAHLDRGAVQFWPVTKP